MKKIIITLLTLISLHVYSQEVIQLFDGPAPGSEDWTWKEATNTNNLFNSEVVYNVSSPTLTAYLPPKAAANGTAVIIAPGGAFHTLSIHNEGTHVAEWLNSQGVAAFVLKYRVARSFTDDPVRELIGKMGDFEALDKENEPIIPLATADGIAAMKHVRSEAKKYNINPDKIGFMGFSAGGTLTMSVAYSAEQADKPNFLAPIYAYEPAVIGNEMPVKKTPIFIAVAGDDGLKMMPYSINIYKKWYEQGHPAELHIYERGDHGFGMRTQNLPVDSWYDRFGDWLKDHKFITPPPAPASPFERIPSPNDTLVSVRYEDDKTLSFSIYAPEAEKVTVNGDFPGGYPALSMKKGFSGVWTVNNGQKTTPNIYTYDFTVDGIRTLDPKNNQTKESNSLYSSLVEIKGEENSFQEVKDVPHGKVEKVWYTSNSLGGITRRLHVYLPPNFEQVSQSKKLPVLYLLHGGGDNDASWSTAGRANTILDNLYAENKLEPMIVVMPAGHAPVPGQSMGVGVNSDPFCRDFINEIIPFIEANYPVKKERNSRAIAGLSMGGIQTVNLALWRPELFGYVYPMSTGYFPNNIEEIKSTHTDVLKNPEINKFNQFLIGIGTEDFAYPNNQNMMKLFKENGVQFDYYETSGNHNFLFWRKHLAYIAPLMFK
ncbi:alpha/beta hydrolase-fold protein [Jiulongibacter sp. NS-SX5]|uniref:alpha/beta hydrolase-fold protein n=1 Tax=Jiulongibacter sp. NS-SX5 TaxID=3463854 RepID=UPI0040597C49